MGYIGAESSYFDDRQDDLPTSHRVTVYFLTAEQYEGLKGSLKAEYQEVSPADFFKKTKIHEIDGAVSGEQSSKAGFRTLRSVLYKAAKAGEKIFVAEHPLSAPDTRFGSRKDAEDRLAHYTSQFDNLQADFNLARAQGVDTSILFVERVEYKDGRRKVPTGVFGDQSTDMVLFKR